MGIFSIFSRMFGAAQEKPAAEVKDENVAIERKEQNRRGRGRGKRGDGAGSNDGARRERASRKDGDSFRGPKASPEEQAENLQRLECFVDYVVKALVDYPDEVKVNLAEAGESRQLSVVCRASDRGKIIGKHGKTIMALRSLVAGVAGRTQNRVSVEVIDDEKNEVKD